MDTAIGESVHPGEVLREEFMRPFGVGINRLAREIPVPPGGGSAIVNGRRAVTADSALRLGRYFGTFARFRLNLQAEYDLRVVEGPTWPEVQDRIPQHGRAPAV